jgi:hypothetical protein
MCVWVWVQTMLCVYVCVFAGDDGISAPQVAVAAVEGGGGAGGVAAETIVWVCGCVGVWVQVTILSERLKKAWEEADFLKNCNASLTSNQALLTK